VKLRWCWRSAPSGAGRTANASCAHGFTLVHLGPRVLRTETAVVAALAIARARLGWMR